MNIDWTLAGAVILSGLAIVFLILIILIWAVMFTSKLVNGASARSAAKPETPTEARPGPAQAPTAAQDGIEEETVAAISAAVHSYMSEAAPGAAYAIRRITRSTGGRPVWGFAGMQQNTRPF